MKLFPAIDILDKVAVRLLYGKREQRTIYGDAVEQAQKWTNQGAEYIHIVDLNGAFDHSNVNKDILVRIRNSTKAILQLGGGLRTLQDIQYAIEHLGYDRIVLGSACVQNPKLVEQTCALYGNKIVAGLDALDGKLKIKGWAQDTLLSPQQVALKLKEYGISDIVYTDIGRDGALVGANVAACKLLQEQTGMNIIASGGIKGYSDIVQLKDAGIYGAIIGKALYEGKIELTKALELCK